MLTDPKGFYLSAFIPRMGDLRYQIGTSSIGRGQHRNCLLYVFIEHGCKMLCLDASIEEDGRVRTVAMKNKTPNIRILTIRGQKVVLDSDLAPVYGVTTKRLNEQFRRNRKRFPKDFAFQLTAGETDALRSQIATSSQPNRLQTVAAAKKRFNLRSQFAISSSHGGRRYRPWAFTEHGALQAANVLRSDRAIAMSVYVIRAFIEQREKLAANAAILKRLAEIDKTLLEHDTALRDVYQQLLPLLAPPPEPPRRQIGFSAGS